MTSMTLPYRISDFLNQRRERMYCDSCIQERIGLKWRQQVQLITATLAVTTAYRREFNKCCTCEGTKQVTYAVGSNMRQADAKPSVPVGNAGSGRAAVLPSLWPGKMDASGNPGVV